MSTCPLAAPCSSRLSGCVLTNFAAVPCLRTQYSTFNSAADWILSLQPGDQYYHLGRQWLGTVMYVACFSSLYVWIFHLTMRFAIYSPIVLQASGSALLDARENFEDQRTCTQLALSWVNYYGQCLDVSIILEHYSITT